MREKLARKILRKLNPSLNKRILAIIKMIKTQNELNDLKSTREHIFSMISNYPENSSLKKLLRKVNIKINNLK